MKTEKPEKPRNTGLQTTDPAEPEAPENWESLLSRVPVKILKPGDYPHVLRTLFGVVRGESWAQIAGDSGMTLFEFLSLKRISPVFRKLAVSAMKLQEEFRQLEREEAAHERAVEGAEVPVYSIKGDLVGSYKKPSDPLMQFLLRAGNPDKYSDNKQPGISTGGVVLQFNFGTNLRKEKRVYAEDKIKVETIETGDTANTAGNRNAQTGGLPGAEGP